MASLAEEQVSTRVGKVVVARGGSGRALVYLHSATGEGAGTPFLQALADGHDVIAPLFPGFGESEGLDAIDDMEDAAFHVLDLLDVLGLDQVVLAGLSLGGWMAAEVATRWPERISALVLVNPVGLHIDGAPIGEVFGRDPLELAQDLVADPDHPLVRMARMMSTVASSNQEIPFDLVRPLLQSLAATAKVAWDPYMHDPKLLKRLPRITAPTLIVRGAADALVPPVHADTYAAAIPDARVADVAGAGHLLPLEKPDELAELVREFLATASGAGG